MDMTGEDVSKTGGSFLIERWPDPGAVWERPWDPHSEWGSGNVRAQTLKGDLINDLHLAICERVAARDHWIVKTNPYEGGSDHTVFGDTGVPSLLNWHFTDRNYHASTDTADKVSPNEMRNVAVAVTAGPRGCWRPRRKAPHCRWLLSSRRPVRRASGSSSVKAAFSRACSRTPRQRRRVRTPSFKPGASGTARPSSAPSGSSSDPRPPMSIRSSRRSRSPSQTPSSNPKPTPRVISDR